MTRSSAIGELYAIEKAIRGKPPDPFWADPFVVLHQGRRFVFLEESVTGTYCLNIRRAEIPLQVAFVEFRRILRLDEEA